MKRSEIYWEAARHEGGLLPDWSEPACCLIDTLSGEPHSAERKAYAALFAPEKNTDPGFAWAMDWPDPKLTPDEWQEEMHACRVLALCFMAAIAEDEERRAK